MQTYHIRVWALSLLTLFVAYYTSVVVFAHVHVVGGVMIVHSHPFTQHHSHTAGQTLSLHFLSSFYSLDEEETELIKPDWHVVYSLFCVQDNFRAVSAHTAGIHLRAPPFMSFQIS